MKITVTGSLGHIGRPLVEKLVNSNHEVTVISSSEERAAEIEGLGAMPAIGSVEDADFLTNSFSGADAVYTMVPPTFQAADWKQHIANVGQKYAEAIKKSGVKYVVNLSSIGAHLPTGAGPVSGIHYVEKALNELEGIHVRHLRPASFYINYYASIPTIEKFGIIGNNYPGNTRLVLVDVNDIAQVAFQELDNLSFSGKSFVYIASDLKTADEVTAILGQATGKNDLKWVELSDEDLNDTLTKNGLPENVAANFVEMGKAIREGRFFEDYKSAEPNGLVRFAEFARQFAKSVSAAVVG